VIRLYCFHSTEEKPKSLDRKPIEYDFGRMIPMFIFIN